MQKAKVYRGVLTLPNQFYTQKPESTSPTCSHELFQLLFHHNTVGYAVFLVYLADMNLAQFYAS